MNAVDKERKLAEMPEDYKPSKPLEFLGLDMDKREGFEMLTDAEAGQVVKRLYRYAQDYADSYDASLIPDTSGLSQMAGFMLKVCCHSFRRMEDGRRESSFLRSGANGGGAPKKSEHKKT